MLGKLNLLKASWSLSSLTAKVGVIAVATTIGLANVVGSTGATLDAVANNTTAQGINSGTLSLTLGNGNFGATTSVGFDSYLTKLRPTDTINRFVDYTTGSDMGWQSPTLGVTATGPSGAAIGDNAILVGATNGLKVWVQTCGASTWADATTCTTGSPQNVIGTGTGASSVLLSTLIAGAQSMNNLIGTASAVNHLKYTISLPDKTETTVNGTTKKDGGGSVLTAANSIQGKSVELVWTVTVVQTAGTDTNA
jgi:hypothetical protein